MPLTSSPLRRTLVLALAGTSLLTLSIAARAQDQAAATSTEGTTTLEEIIVDGGSGGVITADGYVGKSSATGAKVDTPFLQTPQSVSTVTEVGCRRRLTRSDTGEVRVDSIDVYLLLSSLDEAPPSDETAGAPRHDALRFGKTLDDGGAGQIARLEEFARLVASVVGRPML